MNEALDRGMSAARIVLAAYSHRLPNTTVEFLVRSVIAAIEEPTDQMVVAAQFAEQISATPIRKMYKAMIAQVLK